MSKSVAICTIIAVGTILSVVAFTHPEFTSDKNAFLKDFIGANLLNILGVILAISIASAAQLHLEFNKFEERHGRIGLDASRRELRGNATGLIVLFAISTILLITKPLLATSDLRQALFNGALLWILQIDVLLLSDLVSAAFAIKAEIKSDRS